ncbi:uncharacterized protein [Asterias amurensis]|uniref:uncharacterized protein n=1 Tax=Asterias amurensis TaxID=7602 RepID=UPI003AB4BA89
MEYLPIITCFVGMLIALLPTVLAQQPMYIATFSMAGYSGNITFTPSDTNTTISVLMTLPTSGTFNWAIHERPTVYEQRPACGEKFTGDVFQDLTAAHGMLTGSTGVLDEEFTSTQLQLTGVNSISGRSLVLHEEGSSTLVCANILDYGSDVVTGVARFMSPFAGTVTFRQRQYPSQADTSILVDLYNVVETMETQTYHWTIHRAVSYTAGMTLKDRCQNTETSVFADLTGDITVTSTDASRTKYLIDTTLLLNDNTNSIIGKNLVFKDSSGTFIACSPIQKLLPKTVSATISVSGVYGNLEFNQRSPYDPTSISVNLANLQGLAGGYHVHEYPTTSRVTAADLPASNDNVGGHFNPFDVVASNSPAPGTGTNDQYEVGDISGKFGKLTGLDTYSAEFIDWNLPLYGKYSIIGRSIVVHKTIANERWVYGNINYPTDVITVQADFRYVVAGKIVFRQDPSDPYSDTTVFVEVSHADGMDTTIYHNFHVHMKPIANDHDSEDGRCSSTAGHFNPFVDASKTNYGQCVPDFPLRCEVGDLSRKATAINIPSASTGVSGKYFFTDPLLPLSGVYSVSNRSVVIHKPERGPPRYACADLHLVPPVSIATGSWTEGPVTGKMTLTQGSEFDRTKLTVDVAGLSRMAKGWHIHVLPINQTNVEGPCSGASVQGHYNPFGIVGSPVTGTNDMYEVGDLSGKFGSFVGDEVVSEVYMDSNLDLSGLRSVNGRSMVIHRDDVTGSRWVCTDIDRVLTDDDFTLVARASFSGDSISGVVIMRQTRYASGYVGDTTLEVDLSAAEDIEYDLVIHHGETRTSREIYNPYKIMDQACSISRLGLCAVGDLTSKHGTAITNNRALHTDTNLPLFGLNSVIGRNLAAGPKTGGSQTSSLIAPEPASGKKMTHNFPARTDYDAYEFQSIVAREIASGNTWQVVTSEEPKMSTVFPDCSSVGFWLIGPNAEDLATAFTAAAETDKLDSYSSTKLCSADSSGVRQAVPSTLIVFISTIVCVCTMRSLHYNF